MPIKVSNLYLATGSTMGPNLVTNGGFEIGWVQPWKTVLHGSGGLPGWQVTMGDIVSLCAALDRSGSIVVIE